MHKGKLNLLELSTIKIGLLLMVRYVIIIYNGFILNLRREYIWRLIAQSAVTS